MSRCRIGYEREDGEIVSVYCHGGGYPSMVGKMLLEHYTDIEKIKKMVAGGRMSTLGKEIGDEPVDFYDFQDEVCRYYVRDRGEDWDYNTPFYSKDLGDFFEVGKQSDARHIYLFWNYKGSGERWWAWKEQDCCGEREFFGIDLPDAIRKEEEEMEEMRREAHETATTS